MDKFSIVYEFNSESPLITYMATRELEAKNYSKAVELLSTAIDKYPNHVTPYFQCAVALAHENQFEKARDYLAKGNNLLGEEETLNYYSTLVDSIKREADGISVNFDDTINEVLEESFIEPEQFGTTDDFDLADESVKNKQEDNSSGFEETSIVTETLAEIYASQSNFEEAIEIYEKLKDIKPENIDRFNNRINELKIIAENKKQKRVAN